MFDQGKRMTGYVKISYNPTDITWSKMLYNE